MYLAMGMSVDDYWNGDADLVKAYRKAQELKNEMVNQQAWLQGMYIYEALCDVAPILRPFSRAKKPLPYPEQPYQNMTSKSQDREGKRELTQEEKNDLKARTFMEMFAVQFNAQFEKKGG